MVVVVAVTYNCVASYIGVSYTREIVHNSCNTLQLYPYALIGQNE
jgi:hypothetical protein